MLPAGCQRSKSWEGCEGGPCRDCCGRHPGSAAAMSVDFGLRTSRPVSEKGRYAPAPHVRRGATEAALLGPGPLPRSSESKFSPKMASFHNCRSSGLAITFTNSPTHLSRTAVFLLYGACIVVGSGSLPLGNDTGPLPLRHICVTPFLKGITGCLYLFCNRTSPGAANQNLLTLRRECSQPMQS